MIGALPQVHHDVAQRGLVVTAAHIQSVVVLGQDVLIEFPEGEMDKL